jgi:hypothetical protein
MFISYFEAIRFSLFVDAHIRDFNNFNRRISVNLILY